MKLCVDAGAAALLETLHRAGHRAYVVGGCVRDGLLGRVPHDWDLCTSATPQQVLELFGAERCIPTGLQHGTVTVKQDGQCYEVTTFRTEDGYTDGRHPDHVAFVSRVEADLARRDFTINAMAYDPEEGLVDPFDGRGDLARGLVRAVGQPGRRFEEVSLLVSCQGLTAEPAGAQRQIQARRLLGRLGMEALCQLLWLAKAQHPEQIGALEGLEAEAQSARQSGVCCRADQLAVNGRDLLAAGVAPGPAVGRILQALLEQVIQGSLTNKKEDLLAEVPLLQQGQKEIR